MSEPRTCGRCRAVESKSNPVRMALVNVEKEARQDGELDYSGTQWDHGYRCVDRDACRARVRSQKEPA